MHMNIPRFHEAHLGPVFIFIYIYIINYTHFFLYKMDAIYL